jgi:hypothetical protein
LAPALQSTRASLAGAIKNEAPSEKLRRLNLRDILVTTQVALSVVLLIGSILVVRSLQHALSLNLGFEPQHAAVLSYDFAAQGYDEERGREFQRLLLAKVRSLPGIEAAGIIDGLPLTLNISNSGIFLKASRSRARATSPGQHVLHHSRLSPSHADAPDGRPRPGSARYQDAPRRDGQ